jgi:hypothetical protein
MGREVVRQESGKDPRKHSRLWDYDDIYDVLENEKVNNIWHIQMTFVILV